MAVILREPIVDSQRNIKGESSEDKDLLGFGAAGFLI